MEPRSQEYNNWDKLVKKTVAAKVKANLQPSYYSRNMDNCCSKGNRLSHTILSKSQSNHDNHSEKTQTSQKKPTQLWSSSSSRPDSSETFEKKA